MIPTEDVISIHNLLIERFGGITGIRDKNALESALIRPYQTFEGQDL
jgi:death-on-curing protein